MTGPEFLNFKKNQHSRKLDNEKKRFYYKFLQEFTINILLDKQICFMYYYKGNNLRSDHDALNRS